MNCARRARTSKFEATLRPIFEARRSRLAFKMFAAKIISDPMWTASARRAARQARKDKVMARTARKEAKVKTRVRIQIPTRKLFVGTVVRKATSAQTVGRTQRFTLALEEANTRDVEEKPKKGTSKGACLLEEGDQAAAVDQQPQPALASSLDLASFETPGRSPHLDPEGWLRWTYDTGVAISAFSTGCKDRHRNGGE